jgi:hypothetical protein
MLSRIVAGVATDEGIARNGIFAFETLHIRVHRAVRARAVGTRRGAARHLHSEPFDGTGFLHQTDLLNARRGVLIRNGLGKGAGDRKRGECDDGEALHVWSSTHRARK